MAKAATVETWHRDVDAIDRRAIHFSGGIEPFGGLPDQLEFIDRF